MSSTQVGKRYGNDWAKSKSRYLVRDMIQRNLGYKKPQDLRVLCFPGNEAVEVREVYDPLGIPRENIVGLERDREVAEKIRAQNLGIQVVNQTLEDYVASQTSLGFDVVSLDYSGTFNKRQLENLEKICKSQTSRKFVVHQANLAKRDGQNVDTYTYFGRIATTIGSENICDSQTAQSRTIDVLGRGDLRSDESFKEYRSLSYSMMFRNLFGGVVSTKGFANKIKELLLGYLNPTEKDRYLDCSVGEFLGVRHAEILSKILGRQGLRDEKLLLIISTSTMRGKFSPVFGIADSKMYSYISESGDPMIGDIYYLERNSRLENAFDDINKIIGFPTKILIKNRTSLQGIARDISGDLSQFIKMFIHSADRSKEREFLGSSALPVLTKARAIEEFRSGATVDQVREKYRGVNGKPLAQWKAHVTMGTYEGNRRTSEEVIVEDVEDSDLEKITKEEAVDLLSNGIPVDEIFDTYPNSFSKGQLRAFKAWITMRNQGN